MGIWIHTTEVVFVFRSRAYDAHAKSSFCAADRFSDMMNTWLLPSGKGTRLAASAPCNSNQIPDRTILSPRHHWAMYHFHKHKEEIKSSSHLQEPPEERQRRRERGQAQPQSLGPLRVRTHNQLGAWVMGGWGGGSREARGLARSEHRRAARAWGTGRGGGWGRRARRSRCLSTAGGTTRRGPGSLRQTGARFRASSNTPAAGWEGGGRGEGW